MTVRQLDRRARVITAVQELVAERGVADLQVKEIADRAGVSFAAIYRYFSSKDHLLAEALLDWATRLTRGRRPVDDFVALVRHGVAAYGKAPEYAELFLVVAASRDPHALASFGQMGDRITEAMYGSLSDLDPVVAEDIVRVIGSAWLGGLFDCVHRRADFADLERSLEAGCRMLLQAALG